MTPSEWIQAARDFGIPVVMLGFMALGLWKTLQWSAVNLGIPLRDRLFKFLDRLEESVLKVEQSVVQHGVMLDEIRRYQSDSSEARKAAKVIQEQILTTLKENGISLKEFVCRAEEFSCNNRAR